MLRDFLALRKHPLAFIPSPVLRVEKRQRN
jgi:hypothetical protein